MFLSTGVRFLRVSPCPWSCQRWTEWVCDCAGVWEEHVVTPGGGEQADRVGDIPASVRLQGPPRRRRQHASRCAHALEAAYLRRRGPRTSAHHRLQRRQAGVCVCVCGARVSICRRVSRPAGLGVGLQNWWVWGSDFVDLRFRVPDHVGLWFGGVGQNSWVWGLDFQDPWVYGSGVAGRVCLGSGFRAGVQKSWVFGVRVSRTQF